MSLRQYQVTDSNESKVKECNVDQRYPKSMMSSYVCILWLNKNIMGVNLQNTLGGYEVIK